MQKKIIFLFLFLIIIGLKLMCVKNPVEKLIWLGKLDKINFNYSYKLYKNFKDRSIQKASFKYANLTGTCFKKANLSNTCFEGAVLFNVCLKKTIVQNANFKNARCLTNKQKEYLRNNGAINVPENLTEEELEKEIEEVSFKTWPDQIYKFFKKNIKKLWNKLRNNEEIPEKEILEEEIPTAGIGEAAVRSAGIPYAAIQIIQKQLQK